MSWNSSEHWNERGWHGHRRHGNFWIVPLVFAVLYLGGPIEKAIHRRWGRSPDD